jgi:U3 small nucleolar RNA-associated protein 20
MSFRFTEEPKTTAVELQDLIHGSQRFLLRTTRSRIKGSENDNEPEAAAKRKTQRNVIKKGSRKRKERGFL